MQDLVNNILAVTKGMWKFRWPGLLVAWLGVIIGVIIVGRLPDKYEASARIYVDTQSILKPLMSGLTVQPNVEQQVIMLSRTLITRPNVEKLVRMADLDLKNESKARQEAMVEGLMRTLEVRSLARDNLYLLSFNDASPDRAKRVVQSLVSIFVESSMGASRKDSDSAKVFLNEQIKNYEAKLREAEDKVKEFRLRNLDLQTGSGQDSASRLGEISAQLEQAKLELREAENARDAAKQQLASEQTQTSSLATQGLLQESAQAISTPEIDARLEAQKRNLDNLLQRFTELHPDIINLRRLIKDIEEQKRKQVQELRRIALTLPTPSGKASNPVTQELYKMIATSEVQVASLRTRVAEYSTRYAQARSMLKTSPQIDAEASQLNRDYTINKKNYEDLVARRQSAIMSGELEVAAGVADFRLIDPPRVSPQPVWPNRPPLYALVLAAAIAAGLLLTFVASQLRPVFYQASDLRDKFEAPLLGVVSMILSEADRQRERAGLVRFVAASGGLIGVYILGISAMSLMSQHVR